MDIIFYVWLPRQPEGNTYVHDGELKGSDYIFLSSVRVISITFFLLGVSESERKKFGGALSRSDDGVDLAF